MSEFQAQMAALVALDALEKELLARHKLELSSEARLALVNVITNTVIVRTRTKIESNIGRTISL